MVPLKPCPRHGEPDEKDWRFPTRRGYWVTCRFGCAITKVHNTPQEAREEWNRICE